MANNKGNIDITGKVFERLTVLGLDFEKNIAIKKNFARYWICKCSCGKEKSISQTNLVGKRIRSCGCLIGGSPKKAKDITGVRFGKLVVLKRDMSKFGSGSGSHWIVKCDCGTVKSTSKHALNKGARGLKGGARSCGCLTIEVSQLKALPKAGADKNSWLSKYKRRCRQKGTEFSLTDEYFYDLCSMNCFYCGSEPVKRSHGYTSKIDVGSYLANGIDRVDPSIGYVMGNCVPCCKFCNFMKTNKKQSDFINLVFKISDNLRSKNGI